MSSFIVSIHLFFCLPLHCFPFTIPSIISFSNESCRHIICPKYDNFDFTIEASSEHSGFISCKTNLLVLFSVHGIRSSLLQHQSSKASIFLRSACFIAQLSQPYVFTGKTIVLITLILVAILTSLLLMSLSRLTIAFLPIRSLLFYFVTAITIGVYTRAQENELFDYIHLIIVDVKFLNGTICHHADLFHIQF